MLSIDPHLTNKKLFWKNINELIYNKRREKRSDIAIENDSGKISSISETAELPNNYYIDLPQNLLGIRRFKSIGINFHGGI